MTSEAWNYASPDELKRVDELKELRVDATAEIRTIYERCRKRMQRKEGKE